MKPSNTATVTFSTESEKYLVLCTSALFLSCHAIIITLFTLQKRKLKSKDVTTLALCYCVINHPKLIGITIIVIAHKLLFRQYLVGTP